MPLVPTRAQHQRGYTRSPTTAKLVSTSVRRTHARIPYYVRTGPRHARPYPRARRATPTQLHYNSFQQPGDELHARTERGIVVPPDVALRTAYERSRRCCRVTFFIAIIKKGSSSKAMNVYALEGISVLCVRARCYRMARRGRVFICTGTFSR